MNLLIVESPAKCQTIKKLLGPGYQVMASYGHIRDLDNKKHFYGIDLENHYQPAFKNLFNKNKYIKPLRDAVKKAETVYLASDDDREGEAISWHLAQVLGLKVETNPRIIFREITKEALTQALEQPTTINLNRVFSQQGRQVLDKLVGYKLSPLLWKHVSGALKLSAGRVQSVVLRLVVDREAEIQDFSSSSYFAVSGTFQHPKLSQAFPAVLSEKLKELEEARGFLQQCLSASYTISTINTKEVKRNPPPPLITSTLQQEASNRLGYSPKTTMRVAQKLYEQGKITYMRTDSTQVSKSFQAAAKKFILAKWGPEYLATRAWGQGKQKAKGAQEAHECIRPTQVNEVSLRGNFNQMERRLYQIIWERTVASQMKPQILEQSKVYLAITPKGSGAPLKPRFIATWEKEIFPGYMVVYRKSKKEMVEQQVEELPTTNEEEPEPPTKKKDLTTEDYDQVLKLLQVGDRVAYQKIMATEEFTQPTARYTEASLVKTLEKKGIGRPSTYSSMIQKILEKKYVSKENIPAKSLPAYQVTLLANNPEIETTEVSWKTRAEKNKLVPTDIGKVVMAFLQENFTDLMDYDFTSQMEAQLDHVAQGEVVWHQVVDEYYQKFNPRVEKLSQLKKGNGGKAVGEDGNDEEDGVRKAKDKFHRLLGTDPRSGVNIYVTMAKYGTCLQIGDDRKTADYRSLDPKLNFDNVTLEDAVKLLQYPKTLGTYEGAPLTLRTGRYGYYLKWKTETLSLPKSRDPHHLDYDQAVAFWEQKLKNPEGLLAVHEHAGKRIDVIQSQWGVFVKYDGHKVPLKGRNKEDAKLLSVDQLMTIVDFYLENNWKKRKKK